MSGLKGFQEFKKDLLFSFLTGFNIGVSLGGVNTSDVVYVNVSISIFIKLLESLSDNSTASLVHGSTNHSEEFVILDKTIA